MKKFFKWLIKTALKGLLLGGLAMLLIQLTAVYDLGLFPIFFLTMLGFDKILTDFIPSWDNWHNK